MAIRRRLRPVLVLAVLLAALAGLPANAGTDAPRWVRVQFAERIPPGALATLEAAGLSGLQYTPDDAYVAFGSVDAAAAAAELDGVSSVEPLRPADKIDEELQLGDDAAGVTVITASGDAGLGTQALLGALALGTTRAYPSDHTGETTTVEARLPAASVDDLARRSDVLYVGPAPLGFFAEDEGSAQILAGNVDWSNPTLPRPKVGYEAFLASKGLDGEGVRVSVTDTGIDETHPDLAGRVVEAFDYGGGASGDRNGHGTHVSGIIGGNGAVLQPFGRRATDALGLAYGVGVAPKVSFVAQPLLRTGVPRDVFPPNDFEPLTRDALSAGAVGWNASWHSGGPSGAGYVARARSLDVVTRDGDFSAEGNQEFMPVFSAGNGGPNPRTITQPKEAKNIVSVASSVSTRGDFSLTPVGSNPDTISSFSSRGPARDGRILPTVTAPGENIISAATSENLIPCGIVKPADGFNQYVDCSGTSMAAPHVTGTLALATQWWRKTHDGDNPSPAMFKALLVNTAEDIGTADIPNGNEGWGRVNLSSLFSDEPRVYVDQSQLFTGRGEEHVLEVEPVNPGKPFRVSLVWTDAPGRAGASKALVNDLDLSVEVVDAGVSYLGNVFAGGVSQPGGKADRLNNTENVFIPQCAAGVHRIRISSFNVPADGVPNNDTRPDQDYALVISNARLVSS